MKELWSRKWGLLFIQKIMSQNRFLEILKLIRFDDKSTRRRRLVGNRFALISDVWYRLIHNCQLAYVPNAYLTVDEQLFPTKVRCQLIKFMPNKPDKFGIKFWLLVDAQSKYVANGFPCAKMMNGRETCSYLNIW